MICNRCNGEMSITKDDVKLRKVVNSLGLPFGGSFVCLKCYPNKKNEVE